jgi:hypothetical protein
VSEKPAAHYDLDEIKRRVAGGHYALTRRANRHATSKGWTREYVAECFALLDEGDLHKSLQHRDRPGQWLDIYRPRIGGRRMYVKFTVTAAGNVLVMSFCMDGEAH